MVIINLHPMILSYNWQIMETLLESEEELPALVKVPQPLAEDFFGGQESPSTTIQPTSLKSPVFGFLFNYYVEQPKINPPIIDLVPEITLYEQVVRFSLLKELRAPNCIYLELQIDNSEIYDNLLVLNIRIRYHADKKPSKITSLEQLTRQAGNRQLNLYSATTYSTIRKEMIVESPVDVDYRYEKEGYLWVKLTRPELATEEVDIEDVEIMNWLANGSESLRKEVVSSLIRNKFRLKGKESYALLFAIQNNITNIQIPYSVVFSYPPCPRTYKMVKTLKWQDYRS